MNARQNMNAQNDLPAPPGGVAGATPIREWTLRHWCSRFAECLRDERGSAMTEYLLISGITLPLACYLFHPANGFYELARNQYNLTAALLMYPGP